MRTLYDSVTASDIPTTAAMVAGYVDGRYAWSDADWGLHPGAQHVRIAVFADTDDGHALDVENGDATPAQSVSWVRARRAAGADPSVYMNVATWGAVRAAFRAAGVTEPHYWVADWTGARHLPAGAVACQYADPKTSGGHYDLSAVAAHWPGVDAPAPAPPPAPGPAKVYTVVQGDTLSGIAARLGIAWPALYAANRATIGPDPDLIRPGERLVIPAAASHSYVVRAGDTLTAIAARLGIAWTTLYADNRGVIGSDPDLIYPGQVLRW